jgi:hypothetical protein
MNESKLLYNLSTYDRLPHKSGYEHISVDFLARDVSVVIPCDQMFLASPGPVEFNAPVCVWVSDQINHLVPLQMEEPVVLVTTQSYEIYISL